MKKLSKKHCLALEAAARATRRDWLKEGEICRDFLLSMHDSINYTFNIRDLNKLKKELKRYCLEIKNYYFHSEDNSSSKNIKDDYLLGDTLFDALKDSREKKNLRTLHARENKKPDGLDINQRWLKKNKNVQVCISGINQHNHEIIGVVFKYLGNKHTRKMNIEQFLSEFVELQPLIDEITEVKEWESINHNYKIYIYGIRVEKGIITYRHKGSDKNRWLSHINIGQFKYVFRPIKEVT